MMKRIGIEDNLRVRIMETYKETRNLVKVRDKKSSEFWMEKGIRQDCLMSPTLFNIYMIDLEEEMEKGQAGGSNRKTKIFWSIIYADDEVLLATREEELKEMLRRFKRFLERKGLSLSAAVKNKK